METFAYSFRLLIVAMALADFAYDEFPAPYVEYIESNRDLLVNFARGRKGIQPRRYRGRCDWRWSILPESV